MTKTHSFAGRFVWRELFSTDVDASIKFYTELFGWTSSKMDMGGSDYVMFAFGEEQVGGLMAVTEDMPRRSHFLDYVTVDDVDAAYAKIEEIGGRTLRAPMDIPGIGRFAVASDPQGAVFAVFKGEEEGATDTDRTPPDFTFCWSEVHARNVDSLVPFYHAIFGWTAEPMPADRPTVVFSTVMGKQVATCMQLPEGTEVPPHWIDYVAVPDTDEYAGKADTLGATILVPPTTIPNMGRFSVLTDPTGAPFALWQNLAPSP
jgi:predicted enzyme related to lactoylglutathione lyase